MRGRPAGVDDSSRILLVEGPDDRHLFNHLLSHHGISGRFELSESGGVDAVLSSLRTRIKFKGLHSLGIVLDADPIDEHPDAVAHLWLRALFDLGGS